jgi:arylsulfatase A
MRSLSLSLGLLCAAFVACSSNQKETPNEVGGSTATGGSAVEAGGNAVEAGGGGAAPLGGEPSGGSGGSAGESSGSGGNGGNGGNGGAVVLPERPNIVVILTDDEGWTATSQQMLEGRTDSKSDFYRTPNIERLASMGTTFSDGYASPNCSPSRLSLLTGKSPARTKMTDIIERKSGTEYDGHPLLPPGQVKNPTERIFAIPAEEQTIAEMIKAHDAKYATAHFGKWHMNGGGPAKHGFDESDGPTSNAEGQTAGEGGDDPKLVFGLTDKAASFVRRNVAKKQPFYLQVSHYATHEAPDALTSTLQKFQALPPGELHDNPLFAAMAADMDSAIGRLLDSLADPNDDGDTRDSILASKYLVLLADNGGVDEVSDNFPLRMGKATTWEGGVRVPFLVAGPGIEPGSRSRVPVWEEDILPTIADWVGAKPAPVGGELDGGSLAKLLRRESLAVTGRDAELFFHFPHYQVGKGSTPMSAVRIGNLKLMHFYETGEDQLFDLQNDLGEERDLAKEQPGKVRSMRRALRDYLKHVKAPMPRLNPEFGKGSLPDVDQDGLNDDWEFRELLTTKYSGTDDPDGDGKDNAAELKDKTDPLP